MIGIKMTKDKYEGFIIMHRKFKNWEWYNNPPTRLIFEHCLYSANFKDEVWQGKIIKRGQFPTSIKKLANANGLTIRQTRTALENLQKTNEIEIQTTSRYSLITVKNWDLYQSKRQTNDKQNDKQTTRQMTNKTTSRSSIITPDNENMRQSKRQAVCNENDMRNDNTITNNITNKDISNIILNNKNKITKENCDLIFSKNSNPDFYFSDDKNKIFEIYEKECPNLIALTGEKRSRKILDKVNNFLSEINSDWDYFKNLCQKANDLKTIANTKIDFEMIINCHIGIMNGKYIKCETKEDIERENRRLIAEWAAKHNEEAQ